MLTALSGKGHTRVNQTQMDLSEALQKGDLQRVLELLKGLFASIPYQLHIESDAYYHSIFYAVMNVLGFDVDMEVSTSRGRVDAVLELEDRIYIFEFKYKHCAPDATPETRRKLSGDALEEGMKQIEDRGYADKYAGVGKTICKAVFAFLGRDDIEMTFLTKK